MSHSETVRQSLGTIKYRPLLLIEINFSGSISSTQWGHYEKVVNHSHCPLSLAAWCSGLWQPRVELLARSLCGVLRAVRHHVNRLCVSTPLAGRGCVSPNLSIAIGTLRSIGVRQRLSIYKSACPRSKLWGWLGRCHWQCPLLMRVFTKSHEKIESTRAKGYSFGNPDARGLTD